ncbi:DUF3408 domain-containing protein [Duncaniella muris]|uniref:DUF3408 domain-containing protein n=1 Tax=Duncaniella muris TaxID=2094150 RepID=UPI003F67AE10
MTEESASTVPNPSNCASQAAAQIRFRRFQSTPISRRQKLVKRHPVNIEEDVWAQFERIARILGDRGANVGSYINAVLLEHLNLYADDIEIWRKL